MVLCLVTVVGGAIVVNGQCSVDDGPDNAACDGDGDDNTIVVTGEVDNPVDTSDGNDTVDMTDGGSIQM